MPRKDTAAQMYGWGPRKILLTALAGVALTIAASVAAWWLLDRPHSEIPAWIEAGATVVGVGAAITAGFYAARAFLLEFQREKRWGDLQASGQASLVAAWPLPTPGVDTGTDGRFVYGAMAYIANTSPLPVSKVELEFYLVAIDARGVGRDRQLLGTCRRANIPPSAGQVEIPLRIEPADRIQLELASEQYEVSVELWFRDAAGVVWHRDAIGNLHAQSEDPAN